MPENRGGANTEPLPQLPTFTNQLPPVALTRRFLAACQYYGSERLATRVVAVGRSTGVSGLPASADWTKWDACEMRAAVEYLERKRGVR